MAVNRRLFTINNLFFMVSIEIYVSDKMAGSGTADEQLSISYRKRKMGAAHFVCFCTHLFLFVQLSNGQEQKMPAEWDRQQAKLFPNPLMNDTKCQVSYPMRICDPNRVLTGQPREDSNNLLKRIEGLGDSSYNCLCRIDNDCPQPTVMMVVGLMKSLNKAAADHWVETKDIAETFREEWKLDDCSVVLASAMENNRYNLNPGKRIVSLLTSNVTDDINNKVNKTFMDGKLEEGIAMTVFLYSKALNETAKEDSEVPKDPGDPGGSKTGFVAVIIIVVVLIIAIVVIAIFIARKYRKQKQAKIQRALKGKESSGNEENEKNPLSA